MTRRLCALLLTLAPFARADRLITVPTARKLLDGSVRLEYLQQFGRDASIGYATAAFGGAWEAEARYLHTDGRDDRGTLDLSYNIIAPLAGFSPGFAVGVQDIADETKAGTRAFLCGTIRNEFGAGNAPFDVTVGLFAGRLVTPYVGTSVPLYAWASLLAEQDGRQGQLALEARPTRGLRLRLIARSGNVLGSVGYTVSFK